MNKYKAAEGKVLPLKINKQTVYITSESETEIDLSQCDYQTCIHLHDAIKNKEISLVLGNVTAQTKSIKQLKGE